MMLLAREQGRGVGDAVCHIERTTIWCANRQQTKDNIREENDEQPNVLRFSCRRGALQKLSK
jgi:hypothetical protein